MTNSKRFMFLFTLIAAVAAGVLMSTSQTTDAAEKEQENRFFELRIYTTHPGKLDALHARFRDHTIRIFKKHGMQIVGFWTPTEGEEAKNTLVYMLSYPDADAREKAWKAFKDDPEWQKAYAESREDGPIVMKVENKFLAPTDYSPIK